jgi:hypothetical protein
VSIARMFALLHGDPSEYHRSVRVVSIIDVERRRHEYEIVRAAEASLPTIDNVPVVDNTAAKIAPEINPSTTTPIAPKLELRFGDRNRSSPALRAALSLFMQLCEARPSRRMAVRPFTVRLTSHIQSHTRDHIMTKNAGRVRFTKARRAARAGGQTFFRSANLLLRRSASAILLA